MQLNIFNLKNVYIFVFILIDVNIFPLSAFERAVKIILQQISLFLTKKSVQP